MASGSASTESAARQGACTSSRVATPPRARSPANTSEEPSRASRRAPDASMASRAQSRTATASARRDLG